MRHRTLVLLLQFLSLAVNNNATKITVWYKPFHLATIPNDIQNIKSELAATDVIIYCGYAALPNGTCGVDVNPEGNWGDVKLCKSAVSAALAANVGVQLIIEGRMDGNVHAALQLGGTAFGAHALTIASTYPGIQGFNMDWENGHDKLRNIKPTQLQMDQFNSQFTTVLRTANLTLTACGAQYDQFMKNYSRSISVGGLDSIYDMGLYHGASILEWTEKLNASIDSVGGDFNDRLVVGLSLRSKFIWENTTDSVVARFKVLKSKRIQHIALFAWSSTGINGIPMPVDVRNEWKHQLQQFRQQLE